MNKHSVGYGQHTSHQFALDVQWKISLLLPFQPFPTWVELKLTHCVNEQQWEVLTKMHNADHSQGNWSIDSTVLRCRTKERIWGMRILEGLYSVEDKKRTVGLRNRQISIFQPSRPNIVCEFQSVSNQYLLYTLHSRLVPKALIEDKARFYTSDFVISRN